MAKVNFGGKEFIDVLSFGDVKTDKKTGEVLKSGTLTVPGQFTTKFTAKQVVGKNGKYSFLTTAKEFGRELKISGDIRFLEDKTKIEGHLDVSMPGKKSVRASLSGKRVYAK